MHRSVLSATSLWRNGLKYLKGARATAGGSAAALMEDFLSQDAGSRAASNVPVSQRFFYVSAHKCERTELTSRHQSLQLRLGDARLLASPERGHGYIANLNKEHPLFFAETSPREAGLCPALVYALHRLRIRQLTELQGALVPLVLRGKHVIAHAETGSGKSFGIALALSNRLLREQVNYRLHTVILVPTEELSLQYDKWIRHFAGDTAQMVQVAIRSIPLEVQLGRLHNIQPHVLVGTPERVAEVMRLAPSFLHEKLRRRVDCLVLDEADLILSTRIALKPHAGKGSLGKTVEMDGAGLVDRLFRSRPEEVPAQLIAASATVDSTTARLLNSWTRNDKAVRLTTSFTEHSIPPHILFYFFGANARYSLREGLSLLMRLILQRSADTPPPRVLLLTVPEDVEEVVRFLSDEVSTLVKPPLKAVLAAPLFKSAASRSNKGRGTPMQQPAPRIVRQKGDVYVKDNTRLAQWVEGRLVVGVSSFDNCRGLHVNDVSHVVLYGSCPSATVFLHSAGRTGRMGQEGSVIWLFPPSCGRLVQQVCTSVDIPFHAGKLEEVEKLLVEQTHVLDREE